MALGWARYSATVAVTSEPTGPLTALERAASFPAFMPRPGTLERAQAAGRGPLPGRWRGLAVWAGGALLALLAAEVLMRFYAFAPRVIDGEFGFVPQPGVTVYWFVEGAGRSHWNEHGIRRQDNPAGAPALLMLGDSITEAMQVDDDQTFSARLSV